MRKEQGLVEEEIDSILFSSEYLTTLENMGFSREFRLAEQIKRQRECIQFMAEKMDELKAEILEIKNEKSVLERIA